MNPDEQFKEIFTFPPVQGTNEAEEYDKFVESMVPHCHCAERNRPCDGVLAGGICDNIQDNEDEEYDEDEQNNL